MVPNGQPLLSQLGLEKYYLHILLHNPGSLIQPLEPPPRCPSEALGFGDELSRTVTDQPFNAGPVGHGHARASNQGQWMRAAKEAGRMG